MEQYISKSAVVAGIEKRKAICEKVTLDLRTQDNKAYYHGKAQAYGEVLDYLDTFEVKEVDLDFEQELYKSFGQVKDFSLGMRIARHFFDLGMQASNSITAADRGTAEEIIVNLKRVEQDYRINLTREIEWLRNKVKKGE